MSSQWGSALQGGLSGAGTGAAIGSIVPGIGTAIGTGVGGLLGALGGYFGSSPDQFGQTELQTPEQQQALSALLGQLKQMGGAGGNYQGAQDYLSSLLNRDPGVYDRFAAPYMQQFQQQILPGIAERFAGIGGGLGGGALGSSGFAQALGGAGAGLQANLAGLFSNLQRGAASESLGQYNQLANLGLGQRAFQPYYQPGNTGAIGGLLSGLGQGLGTATGVTLQKQLMDFLNPPTPQGTGPNPNQRTGLG